MATHLISEISQDSSGQSCGKKLRSHISTWHQMVSPILLCYKMAQVLAIHTLTRDDKGGKPTILTIYAGRCLTFGLQPSCTAQQPHSLFNSHLAGEIQFWTDGHWDWNPFNHLKMRNSNQLHPILPASRHIQLFTSIQIFQSQVEPRLESL